MDVPAATPHRRLYRNVEGRALAGVASGLADHLGVSVLVVRLAFAALALAGGSGIVMYAAFWVFVPQREGESPKPAAEGRGQLLALGAVVVGGLLLVHELGLFGGGPSLLPLGAALVGVALVWRQADESQRARWRAHASGPRGIARTAAGGLLLAAGIAGFLA